MYYFGCIDSPGHYLWAEGHKKLWFGDLPDDFPKAWTFQDSWSSDPKRTYANESKIAPNCCGPQGKAIIHSAENWTCLSFPDRSIDDRPNCVSAFMERGILSFDEMIARAWIKFPQVMSRYGFKIEFVDG